MQELRNYEENARLQNLADPMILNKGQFLTERGDHFGAIPADTRLKSSLIMQTEDKEKQNDTVSNMMFQCSSFKLHPFFFEF